MIWAKAALAGGLLVLLAGFAIGSENQLPTPIMGRAQDCGPAISASWLVPGTPDRTRPGSAATADERRAAAACTPIVHESRVLIVTLMGLGSLLALVGWSAIPTAREAEPNRAAPAHS